MRACVYDIRVDSWVSNGGIGNARMLGRVARSASIDVPCGMRIGRRASSARKHDPSTGYMTHSQDYLLNTRASSLLCSMITMHRR